MQKKQILLAFSGGLDTSAIIPWLKETYNAEVICYCCDLGNAPDGNYLKDWAAQLGAKELIFENLHDEFCSRFVFPSIRAGAIYQDDYMLGTSLARPLITERLAYWAKHFNVDAVAHGATGKGNDQIRFERSLAYLLPDKDIIAPWKIWDMKSRTDLMNYLAARGFNLQTTEKVYSVDVNLLHRSCEGGILEKAGKPFKTEEVYEWTTTPDKISQDVVKLSLTFSQGIPVSVNGKKMSPSEILTTLNEIGGKCGLGVVDLLEERTNGMKCRGIYETPGGYLLHQGVKHLKHLCWDRRLMNTARGLGQQLGEVIYDGLWHSPVNQAIMSFFQDASKSLTGTITYHIQNGQMLIAERTSPYALYDENMASFEKDEYNYHHLALGFCKILSYPQMVMGKRDQQLK